MNFSQASVEPLLLEIDVHDPILVAQPEVSELTTVGVRECKPGSCIIVSFYRYLDAFVRSTLLPRDLRLEDFCSAFDNPTWGPRKES